MNSYVLIWMIPRYTWKKNSYESDSERRADCPNKMYTNIKLLLVGEKVEVSFECLIVKYIVSPSIKKE